MRRTLAVGVAAILAVTPFLLPGDRPSRKLTPAERVTLRVNEARAKNGLPPLRFSTRLSRASRRWSARLHATGRFEHARAILGPYRQAGEVIARGYANPVPPWLKSPGHRAILMASWGRVVGFGRVGKTWTGRVARP